MAQNAGLNQGGGGVWITTLLSSVGFAALAHVAMLWRQVVMKVLLQFKFGDILRPSGRRCRVAASSILHILHMPKQPSPDQATAASEAR